MNYLFGNKEKILTLLFNCSCFRLCHRYYDVLHSTASRFCVSHRTKTKAHIHRWMSEEIRETVYIYIYKKEREREWIRIGPNEIWEYEVR